MCNKNLLIQKEKFTEKNAVHTLRYGGVLFSTFFLTKRITDVMYIY